jgi:ferric enterobactin receptor
MPGVRLERYWRTVSSPGRTSFRVARTNAYPTLHIQHPLSKRLDLTLSYSKRIDRPQFYWLRPYPILTKINAIDAGNPALRDQSTDAYEIDLHYRRKQLDVGLILYDRETRHLFSQDFSVNAEGLNLVTPINAGRKTDRGAEIDVSTPLMKRIKGTASINLFDSRVPIDPFGGHASAETFRYTANTTLEWDGPGRGKRPGDIAQLQLVYESPSRSFQIRDKGFLWTTLSYTHSFSRTLSVTGTVIATTHGRHRLVAPLVQEDYEQRDRSPEFKLKLVKSLGAAK